MPPAPPTWLPIADAMLALCVLCASLFCLAAAVGMLRFPDFYMRLHAPTKAATLGVGGLLIASMAASALLGHWHVSELLITLFVFSTAPISANLLAQAALHLRLPSQAKLPAHLHPTTLHATSTDSMAADPMPGQTAATPCSDNPPIRPDGAT